MFNFIITYLVGDIVLSDDWKGIISKIKNLEEIINIEFKTWNTIAFPYEKP